MTLQALLAFLAGLIADAQLWTFEQITGFWPELYEFYLDPAGKITEWIGQWSPESARFLDDPYFWVRRQIAFALGFPQEFCDDPWYYLYYFALQGFARSGTWLIRSTFDVVRQILVFFFRGESQNLTRVEYR